MRKNRLQWLVKNCVLCMKKILAPLIIFLLARLALQAQCADGDHGRIRAMSSFRILGELDLWTGTDASAAYRTLNHEGGMKVTVLDVLKRDTQNGTDGVWLSVLLTAPKNL